MGFGRCGWMVGTGPPSKPDLLVLMMPVDSDSFSAHQRRDVVEGFDDQVARGGYLDEEDERDGRRQDKDGGKGGGGGDDEEDAIMAMAVRRDAEDGAVRGGGQGDAAIGRDVEDLPVEDAAEDVLKKKFDALSFDDSMTSDEEEMVVTTLLPHGPIGPEEVLGTADDH